MSVPAPGERDRRRAAIDEVPLWYHTIEVGPGVVTPGWFDLRPVVERMPWPDVRGKRCLDIATYDGFLAFELERRGAAEVVATDIASHEGWDWPHALRERGPEFLAEVAGTDKSKGFHLAHHLLRSSVERSEVNVYDLNPDDIGEFDVVVCGSLLLHLRDPLRALAAIRSVCRDQFLSAEQVDLWLSTLHRRRPILRLDGLTDQWLISNRAAHVRLLEAAGFSVQRISRAYSIPFGASHPVRLRARRPRVRAIARRLLTGVDGVPHQAILAAR